MDECTAVVQILNRMEENLRDAIYWKRKYEDLNSKGRGACKEMVRVMGEEHGSAAQRLAIDTYKKYGLIGGNVDEAQRAPEDYIQCQTPTSR